MALRTLLTAAILAAGVVGAHAEWPERPITMIVPWAAGGGTDAVARTIAAGLEAELGKPVNVVNRTGGAGVVGHTEIVRARPDGYTIGLATAELVSYKWAGTAQFTYEDMTPVALVNFDAGAFHVAADSKWASMKDAIAGIKSEPAGTYKLSGMGAGAAYHLAFGRLLQANGIDPKAVTVVPSQGAAPGFQELASGGVQIVPSSLPEGKVMVDAGRAKALGVFSEERLEAFPNVPTAKEELGIDFSGGTWRGLVGPSKLPADITMKLGEALDKVVHKPEFETFMKQRGFGTRWARGDDFKSFLATEHARTGEIMGALGLRRGN